MRAPAKPLELILARNFLTSIRTAALLVDAPGNVVFFNDAAGLLLGRRFEETGHLDAAQWTEMFGPLDDSGRPVPVDDLPLTRTLRRDRPAHAALRIRSAAGTEHDIEASGFPIIGADGFQGAIVIFWPSDEEEPQP